MTIGIAVIGGGMAGRAHAAAYRIAARLNRSTMPDIRFVSIGDVSPELGSLAAARFGYERSDTCWQAIAENPDINVVSVAVANSLHREIAEGLVAAGKHVLCEKPLSDTLQDARAMAEVARNADTVVCIGFTFRRAAGAAALRGLVNSGALGRLLHANGRYWCDYARDPMGPMTWRYKGAPGSGALADIGSHAAYLMEFLCGDVLEVSGGRFATAITERPTPLGTVVGHEQVQVRDTYEAVENEDYAGFSARFEQCVGVVQVSRVAAGHPNGLALELFGDEGEARWEQKHPAGFQLMLNDSSAGTQVYRRMIIGPDHTGLRRRPADGRTGRRRPAERGLCVPGARLSRGGRRHRRSRLTAPQRLLRRRRTQHGNSRCSRRVGRQRRRGSDRSPTASGGHAMKSRFTSDAARSVISVLE
jgi:predicted dehydrogenase